MRAILRNLSLLAIATGLAGGAVVGCSTKSDIDSPGEGDSNKGTVGFQLDVAGGSHISSMVVVISGNGQPTITQTLDVDAVTGAVASFSASLVAGSYTVAVSSPQDPTCSGTTPFTVQANNAATVAVTMACAGTNTTGDSNVNVTACTPPIIHSVFVGPTTQAPNHDIVLSAVVDGSPTYLWSVSGGTGCTIASAASASTTMRCTGSGSPSVSLTVSALGCSAAKGPFATTITSGGGGGTGGSAGTGGSSAGTGGSSAGTGGSSAGTGGSSAGTGGTSGTGGGTTAACGDGVLDSGELCDPAYGAPSATQTFVNGCGDNCHDATTAACSTCEQSLDASGYPKCTDFIDCSAFPAPGNVQCNTILSCVRRTGCAYGGLAGNINDCYCGTMTNAQCNQGLGNGVCKTEIENGVGSTVPSVILAATGDPSNPAGLNGRRIACDKSQCPTECPGTQHP